MERLYGAIERMILKVKKSAMQGLIGTNFGLVTYIPKKF